MRHSAIHLALALWLLAAAGCSTHPPPGRGGAAELATTSAGSPPPYWSGEAVHPALRAEVGAGRMDLGPDWVERRLETMSCLDFKLEGLAMAGAAAVFPAELVLAQADRRRALRAFNGGLPRDADLHLADYRTRVHRIEAFLLRSGRPVSAELRDLSC